MNEIACLKKVRNKDCACVGEHTPEKESVTVVRRFNTNETSNLTSSYEVIGLHNLDCMSVEICPGLRL